MPTAKLQHERLIRGIAKGAGVVLFGTILSRLLGYIIRAIIARVYGQDIYGYISTSLAIFTGINAIALFGIPYALPRQISFFRAKGDWSRVGSNIGIAYLFTTLVGIVFSIGLILSAPSLATHFFADPALIPFIRYFGLSIPFFLVLRISCTVFQGLKDMTLYVLFREVLRQVFILAGIILLIIEGISTRHLGSAYTLAYTVTTLISLYFIWRYTHIYPLKYTIAKETMASLFQFSWPLMFFSILMIMLHKVDTIMTGYYLNQSQVGIYNAGVPLGELLSTVYLSFIPIMIPLMTDYYANDDQKSFQDIFHISTKWIYIFTFPLYILILIYPEFFITIFFGREYLGAVNVLRIISTGVFFSSIVGPTGNILVVIGKPRIVLFDAMVAFITNITLNIYLIPKIGITGAAIATAISIIVHNLLTILQIFYYTHLTAFRTVYLKITFAGLIPGVLAYLLFPEGSLFAIAIITIVFGLIFIGLGLLFGVTGEEDKVIFREVKKRLS